MKLRALPAGWERKLGGRRRKKGVRSEVAGWLIRQTTRTRPGCLRDFGQDPETKSQ